MQLVQRDLLLPAGHAGRPGAADAVHVLPVLRAQDRGEEGGRMINREKVINGLEAIVNDDWMWKKADYGSV